MWFDAWTVAGAGATKIGAVVAAPAAAAAGREALATPGAAAATAPASLSAGGGGADGVEGVNVEVEVKREVGGPIVIFGAVAGASAGSWIWPSLIWVTVLPRDGGRRRMKVRRRRREGFVFVFVVGVGIFPVFCFGVWLFDCFWCVFSGVRFWCVCYLVGSVRRVGLLTSVFLFLFFKRVDWSDLQRKIIKERKVEESS